MSMTLTHFTLIPGGIVAEARQHQQGHSDASAVDSSGLFDAKWYRAAHADAMDGEESLIHFCRDGWRQGLNPNPYFHVAWYAKTYGHEFLPDENPLLHYIRAGERENAWPSPHFDPEWYRDNYALDEHESPLRHYLQNRFAGTLSPLPDFDPAAFVASNPDWPTAERDPYLAFLVQPKQTIDPPPASQSPLAAFLDTVGGDLEKGIFPEAVSWKALQRALGLFIPLIAVDETWYCRIYPDVGAAVKCGLVASARDHFIHWGFFEGRCPAPPVTPDSA
jgi:hypothetical protein